MILEDFFTLSEMKDGLTTLARVEELISVMQEQKICPINNLGEAIRQWSTVVSVLAATENKDCLHHFIHLDGLLFLNQWLQEAQKQNSDTNNDSMEQLMNLLLGAVQRLPVNREESLSSGIAVTVKQIICHGNQSIIDRARKLLDTWGPLSEDGLECQYVKKCDTHCDDEMEADSSMNEVQPVCLVPDVSSIKEVMHEGSCGAESANNGSVLQNANFQVSSEVNSIKDVKVSIFSEHTPVAVPSSEVVVEVSRDMNLGTSLPLNCCKESVSIVDVSSVYHKAKMEFSGTCRSPYAKEGDTDDQIDSPQKTASSGSKEVEFEVEDKEVVPCLSGHEEVCVVSSSSSLNALKSVKECVEKHNLDSKECESSTRKNIKSEQTSDIVDHGLLAYTKTTKEVESVRWDLSAGKSKESASPIQGMNAQENANGTKENSKSHVKVKTKVDSRLRSGILKHVTRTGTNETNQKSSDLRLEDGDDALEFAVQVAIEVKREVADREHSSSPETSLEDESIDSGSHELEEENYDQPSLNKSSDDTDHCDSDSLNENRYAGSENFDVNYYTDNVKRLELSKSPPVIQEALEYTEKIRCGFDLNEDINSDEVDCSPVPSLNCEVNFSAPTTFVAALEGVSSVPLTTCRFEEGEHKWKGSMTNAFHCASPRTIVDGEKNVSAHKQKSTFLKIDLNLPEREDNVEVHPALNKQIPVSLSCAYSREVNSRKSERLNWDLNCPEEETLPNPSSYWKYHLQNGDHLLSPASSSSARQPLVIGIDLNDNPSLLDDYGHQNLLKSSSKDENVYRSCKLDDPVVTLMGSRMTFDRKEPVHVHQTFVVNGLGMESIVGGRPSLAYSQMTSPGYGYNGLVLGPSTLSLSPTFCSSGTLPYVVDSGGSTIMPHILGSSVGTTAPPPYRPPFLFSAPGVTAGMGTIGSFRPGVDLNSGAVSMESGDRELGSFRQFLMQGQGVASKDEQIKYVSQSSPVSGLPLKRKEPECGWETYPFSGKQVTSWH